jgi:hypothetical protein
LTRNTMIGFSQRIQLDWLEDTAQMVLAGQDKAQITTSLRERLSDKVSVGGDAERSNREKAITILLRTWLLVPERLQPFRDEGLRFLRALPRDRHLAVHWGMVMVIYPFWGAVAETAGRLGHLQGTFAPALVQRRMRERFGERETVARAARRVLRSFIDWGVLQEADGKGIYRLATPRPVDESNLVAWLVEAVLISNGSQSMPVQLATQTPMLFPFRLIPSITTSPRLELYRQGLDEDIVMLRAA